MNGKKLIELIAGATGLPIGPVQSHLSSILEGSGVNVENMTLEQVRAILADHMQDVLLEAKAEFGKATKPN